MFSLGPLRNALLRHTAQPGPASYLSFSSSRPQLKSARISPVILRTNTSRPVSSQTPASLHAAGNRGAIRSAPHPKAPQPVRDPTIKKHIAHRETLKKKFPQGWSPPRKVSREAMDGMRALQRFDPVTFTTPALAEKFKISPEAVRRILRAKWRPDAEREEKMLEREERVQLEKREARRRGPDEPGQSKRRDKRQNPDDYKFALR